MNKSHFNELLQKLQDGTITAVEKSLLESWYNYYTSQSSDIITDEDLEYSVAALRGNLKLDHKPFVKKLWPQIAIASAVASIVIGVYFFRFSSGPGEKENSVSSVAKIVPGKNGATLTLANGTKILIHDALTGTIANQSGVKISKTKDGQVIYEITDQAAGKIEYNTLTTSRGEQTQVRLPDGSLVFLNTGSSLSYPTSFAKGAKRSVTLTGEGYFEVAKNKVQPFVVSTTKQEVEVLGTHFNINAYTDEKAIKTTLLEGSVRVSSLQGVTSKRSGFHSISSKVSNEVLLKPGEQSVLNEKGIEVASVNLDEAVAWQKGYFRFYDEDIAAVMRKVSRWYNIEVEYAGQLPEVGFNARITKYSSIKDVLATLEKTKAVHFKIEGRKVIVSK
jgi:transmembrane sensor